MLRAAACIGQNLYASFLLLRLSIELRMSSQTSAVPSKALATMGMSMYAAAGLTSSPSRRPAVQLTVLQVARSNLFMHRLAEASHPLLEAFDAERLCQQHP